MSSKEIKDSISSDPFNMFDKWRPMNSNKAKVFFHREDYVIDETYSNIEIPLWVYYWRQAITKDHRSINIKRISYSKKQNNFNVWADQDFPLRPVLENKLMLPIRMQCYPKIALQSYTKAGPTLYGIHTFLAICVHESWHADFTFSNWQNGYKYAEDLDPVEVGKDPSGGSFLSPIGDIYPEWWEKSEEGRNNNFSIYNDDAYGGGTTGVGFNYEENKATVAARKVIEENGHNYYNQFDWSFEKNPTLANFQGKQWNK